MYTGGKAKQASPRKDSPAHKYTTDYQVKRIANCICRGEVRVFENFPKLLAELSVSEAVVKIAELVRLNVSHRTWSF
jgi:hypothetical protein